MKEYVLKRKWEKLLKLARKFKHIPFIEFVLVSGSMATGEASEESDFDVIVGAKKGRVFTARQLTSGFFDLFGERRKRGNKNVKDKICLNHYVAPEGYCLDPPHNEYWAYLYRNLVPLYGEKEAIEKFFRANEWAGEIEIDYSRFLGESESFLKKIGEYLLKGKFGNFIEKIFKKYQIRRIERNLEKTKGYKPLVKYDDTELRFHMDTKRIEDWLQNRDRYSGK